jgi:hypothetical protein
VVLLRIGAEFNVFQNYLKSKGSRTFKMVRDTFRSSAGLSLPLSQQVKDLICLPVLDHPEGDALPASQVIAGHFLCCHVPFGMVANVCRGRGAHGGQDTVAVPVVHKRGGRGAGYTTELVFCIVLQGLVRALGHVAIGIIRILQFLGVRRDFFGTN